MKASPCLFRARPGGGANHIPDKLDLCVGATYRHECRTKSGGQNRPIFATIFLILSVINLINLNFVTVTTE